MRIVNLVAVTAFAGLAACGDDVDGSIPGNVQDDQPFSEISPNEVISLTGTEPFWGGVIANGTFTYRTAENPDDNNIEVEAFAGRGGLSFSGELNGDALDLTITPGTCSDGMSDVTYPFTATLRIGNKSSSGCGWSDDQPAIEPGG